MRAVKVSHIDDDYLATGTHKGADGGKVLRNKGADFWSCGITAGVAVYNTTDGSDGVVTAVTEDEVTCTLADGTSDAWTRGDTYKIYKTDTKDSAISTLSTDRRFGRKVVKDDILNSKGFFLDDVDLDQDQDHVFGPNQPE